LYNHIVYGQQIKKVACEVTSLLSTGGILMNYDSTIDSQELDLFIKSNKLVSIVKQLNIPDDFLYTEGAIVFNNTMAGFPGLDEAVKNVKGKRKIGDYLYDLLEEKRKKVADLNLRAGIKKEYWHKVTNGKILPSKEKLLCLALILKLTIEETEKLLRVAGYSLAEDITVSEAIIGYFIKEKRYSTWDIDEQLAKYGQKTIFSLG
jgi:transcriptional regulator with XRE-family HTH domain